jgi:DNA-binding transcriptional MerR regulator
MERLRLIAQFRRAGLDVRDIRLILERREQAGGETYVDCAVGRLEERLAVIEAERRQIEEALALLGDRRTERAPAEASPRTAAAILRQSRPGRQAAR